MIKSSPKVQTKVKSKSDQQSVSNPSLNPDNDTFLELKKLLRPDRLQDFIGQKTLKKQLSVILQSAKMRTALPEHILFYGPAGLGKTTLAHLISNELGVEFKVLAAPSIQKQGDLVSLLLNIEQPTVVFIDEIHRLKAPIEESLYIAMEDGKVDLILGKGAGAQATRLDLKPFSLVGATTHLGKISKPLKDRFTSIFQLKYYTKTEILKLIEINSVLLNFQISDKAKHFLTNYCKGVPRNVNNLLKRLKDYHLVHNIQELQVSDLQVFLQELKIYPLGLNQSDVLYLKSIVNETKSLKTLAGILAEETETIEQNIEPYLLYLKFINKTNQGRKITLEGLEYLQQKLGEILNIKTSKKLI